jgi:transposase
MEQQKNPIPEPVEMISIPLRDYERFLSYEAKIEFLQSQLEKLQKLFTGSKSERFIPAENAQMSLDLGPSQVTVEPVEHQVQSTTKSSGKKSHSRPPLPANLQREEILLDPSVDLSGAKVIGVVETEILELVEAKIIVKKYVRQKYLLANGTIVIADLPSLPIPRGNAGPGLLAHIEVGKFVDHQPFHRQRQMFKRLGVDLAESTINDWFRSTCDLVVPLYDCHKKLLLKSSYLMADETPIPVQTEDKPGATHKGYHWVYYDPIQKMVLFDYRKGRGREGPDEILKNFKGTLQADGYAGYDHFGSIPGITLLACMAHARRKFDEALKNDKARAEHVLGLMQQLYKIERQAREEQLDYDQRKELRQEKSAPVLQELHTWLKENVIQTLPKSAIGIAIAYTLHLWPRLVRYLDDGRYEIDNNLIENSIRPVALGRKNYLFAGSHEAAQRAAMMYSFFATCKVNSVEPQAWLTKVLERISDHSIQRLEELLPQNLK